MHRLVMAQYWPGRQLHRRTIGSPRGFANLAGRQVSNPDGDGARARFGGQGGRGSDNAGSGHACDGEEWACGEWRD